MVAHILAPGCHDVDLWRRQRIYPWAVDKHRKIDRGVLVSNRRVCATELATGRFIKAPPQSFISWAVRQLGHTLANFGSVQLAWPAVNPPVSSGTLPITYFSMFDVFTPPHIIEGRSNWLLVVVWALHNQVSDWPTIKHSCDFLK